MFFAFTLLMQFCHMKFTLHAFVNKCARCLFTQPLSMKLSGKIARFPHLVYTDRFSSTFQKFEYDEIRSIGCAKSSIRQIPRRLPSLAPLAPKSPSTELATAINVCDNATLLVLTLAVFAVVRYVLIQFALQFCFSPPFAFYPCKS